MCLFDAFGTLWHFATAFGFPFAPAYKIAEGLRHTLVINLKA